MADQPVGTKMVNSAKSATDSSSDKGGIVHKIVLGVKARDNKDDGEASKPRGSLDQKQTEMKKYRGVRMRKWGKWCSEIRDPFEKKRLWLLVFLQGQNDLLTRQYTEDRMVRCVGDGFSESQEG
uniref:AP2/ERF domain-containing protein n=1 Tax=Lactuca sativa TaxID=4236 RepID=A0A9R1USL5_LACSA|nr:hypothetical protein LSAT_V11C800404880 [Lactuca sativa]